MRLGRHPKLQSIQAHFSRRTNIRPHSTRSRSRHIGGQSPERNASSPHLIVFLIHAETADYRAHSQYDFACPSAQSHRPAGMEILFAIEDLKAPDVSSGSKPQHALRSQSNQYDVFISYRRVGGAGAFSTFSTFVCVFFLQSFSIDWSSSVTSIIQQILRNCSKFC